MSESGPDWVTRNEFEDFRREVHKDAKDFREEMNQNFRAVFSKMEESARSRSLTLPVLGGVVAMIISVWSVVERPLSSRLDNMESRQSAIEQAFLEHTRSESGMMARLIGVEKDMERAQSRLDEVRALSWRMHSAGDDKRF